MRCERIGLATMYCGDFRDAVDIKFDAMIVDPPYGMDYKSGFGSREWGDGSIHGDITTEIRDAAIEMASGKPCLVFGTWKVNRPMGINMLLIWDKGGALGMGDLSIPWKPQHEEIYVIGNTGYQGKRTSDVLRYAPVQSMAKNGRVHPMQKPEGLMHELVSKTVGDVVFDPTMGSGSTGVAAVKQGREFVGFEIDPKMFDIACERLRQAQSQQALFSWEAA